MRDLIAKQEYVLDIPEPPGNVPGVTDSMGGINYELDLFSLRRNLL